MIPAAGISLFQFTLSVFILQKDCLLGQGRKGFN